ncbi:MAG: hypothetical protein R3300_01205 [Candidatus Promineifilaceae bacterium]|nr:hypothetical protein [Candidatus Promineifilaceae bacterium]
MAGNDKKKKLELTIQSLQDRWGSRAIRRLSAQRAREIAHIPTGFADLDKAIGIGGLPRGRLSEIVGVPTSGTATLALKTIAQAQAKQSQAIYIDVGHTFDPDYGARCGLLLNQLLLVRPHNFHQGLAILQDFILGGDSGVLVFDVPFSSAAEPGSAETLTRTLDRIMAPLGQTAYVLLFLLTLPPGSPTTPSTAYPNEATLPHYAAVRLFVQRQRWLYQAGDIHGYEAQVLVAKNKVGPTGKRVSIAITFDST